jgi:hypothetical protein
MKTIDRLKSFLNQQSQRMRKIRPNLDWKYGGFEELILDCGIEMNFTPLPENIERGLPKNCYYNCFELLKNNFALTYCEGYALDPELPLPLIHAWLVDNDGKVIDPTWDDCNAAYLGIPFDTKWFISLLRSRRREDCLAVIESNYLEGFSLLKEGLPNDAIRRVGGA